MDSVCKSIILIKISLVTSLVISASCIGDKADNFVSCEQQAIIDSIAFQDTIRKWEAYAESSDEGIWVNDDNYKIYFEFVATYGGEEDILPPFYTADYFSVSGDSVFISDDAAQSLVCMTLDGEVQWKAGELGEGPGYFLGIGRTAVSGQYIAVCNNGANAIDLFSRAGEFVRRIPSISAPQDVKFLSDSTLLVFSKSQPGGDIHLLNIATGDIEKSFGDGEWTVVVRNHAPRDLSGIISSDGRVAYISQFEHRLLIYNIYSQTQIFCGARRLPSETHGEIVGERDEEGITRGLLFTVPGILFEGSEGMINITLPNVLSDGQMLHGTGPYNYAPVTIVDRYNWDGIYLDSYCVPDSILSDMYYSQEWGLIARQRITEIILRFVEIDEIHD